MDYFEFFGNLFLLTFSIFAGIVLAFRIVWPMIESQQLKIRALLLNKQSSHERLQLRINAYERLLLYSHRISPEQVMMRHHASSSNKSVVRFQAELLADIESEFQHNLTQQLYVSDEAWLAVTTLKDNTLSLFKNVASQMGKDGSCEQYFSIVMNHLSEVEPNPYQEVQSILKKEMNAAF